MSLLSRLYLFYCAGFLLRFAGAQTFLSAISAYPQLSNFTSLLTSNPSLASSLLSGSASSPETVLVPDDGAFLSFEEATGQPVSATAQDILEPLLHYHVLSGSFSAQDFDQPEGITIPTGLTGPIYNNRSAGSALSSVGASNRNHDGQVVFIAPKTTSTSFTVRQLSSPGSFVQSGLAHQANLTAIDGSWDGGRFQIVDAFLTLPEVCTKTIRAWGLSSLDASLNRTGLASVLDHVNNVTCLGPSDDAFLQAGNPDSKLNASDLSTALLFHTIPQPLYSNFLTDGQTFKSLSNATVRVSFKDGDIYFNDAKVTQSNVLTNNGLMHVLDRIMSPLEDEAPPETTATTVSPSATATSNVTGSTSPTTTAPIQVTGAASISVIEAPTWWFVELLGVIYGYLYLI
jgi:uncharacterized surface protein with fasciclin (FAS1) repeats